MTNIVLLLLCLGLGIALRHFRRVPEDGHLALNAFIIHAALPALILLQIHGVRLSTSLMLPVAMPWLLFSLGVGIFAGLSRVFAWPLATTGALILTGALANTSFIGLPMIETFYGRDQMATGILIDQLGTYLVLSTLGIVVACLCSRGTAAPGAVLRRIVTFPPLIALVLAFALLPVTYPALVSEVLSRLGDTLAPLALVSVGLQLRPGLLARGRGVLAMGLGFKLLLAPLVLALVYVVVFRAAGDTTRVTLFEAAMGPQIGGAIVATQYGLDPPLVALMVGAGITLSFITLPLWWWGLQMI
jgi:predicted permease